MICSYNPEAVGDVLMVLMADSNQVVTVERKKDVARIYEVNTGRAVGINFFNIASKMQGLVGNGQINLTNVQVNTLNELINDAGFSDYLEHDSAEKLVVGYVSECQAHPNSDHLSITQTQVSQYETLQIVCGAPNIAAGQKVVVAKPGMMMPDGLVIWPGELRGEKSNGMICSARELGVPNAPSEKGILILPNDVEIGTPFSLELIK